MADAQPPISESRVGGYAQRFRKRPVEIEAVRVSDAIEQQVNDDFELLLERVIQGDLP